VANSKYRVLITLTLIAVAGGLALLGRLGLDWLISAAPNWESEIERFGGWVLGMLVGLLVVIPVFRMYDVFNQGPNGARTQKAASKDGAKGDETKRRR